MRLGLLIWSHASNWSRMLAAARLADELDYDHVWTSDHLLATVGDPHQPIFEGWAVLAAWAGLLTQGRLGLLVSANTLRHPAVVAKMVTTIDHISSGRALLGLGAGWFAPEHLAHGIDFGGSTGERLAWLDEATEIIRRLLAGDEVTHDGPRYRLDRARHAPLPLQPRLPIMIGGGGERRTLRTVAAHADMWNLFGTPDDVARKGAILDEHCRAIGRDPGAIERTVTVKLVIRDDTDEAGRRWAAQADANGMRTEDHPGVLLGPPAAIAQAFRAYQAAGFQTVIVDAPAPYDEQTIIRLATQVRPLTNHSS